MLDWTGGGDQISIEFIRDRLDYFFPYCLFRCEYVYFLYQELCLVNCDMIEL